MELVLGFLAVYGTTGAIMLAPVIAEQHRLKKNFNKLLTEKE